MQLHNIINDMQPGNYYIDNNIVHIVADYVSRKELNFTCPFCWSRYKKDGTPTKTAKKITHYHGSFTTDNRSYRKFPHCDPKRNDKPFEIYVTNNTTKR